MTINAPAMNPFPGLRPFRPDEDYLFFGREEQTLELLKRLASHRFVAVVGTSGSGKSSLVRCGLLSELQGGKMRQAGAAWEIAVTHPGGNPLALLAEALLEADLYDRRAENVRENLLATLSRSHFGLVEAVKQAGMGDGANFLLVVDQFEEIFRFHEAGQEQQEAANEFVSLLLEAVSQSEVPIYVVLTMRSDFIGECGQFEGLAEMVNRGEYLIPRLTRDQYKRVIDGPIKVAGGKITPRLMQRLLNDMGQQADQLPCLQHALMRTWSVWSQRGDSEALDLDDYQRVGRMSEALSLHADEVYESLDSDRQRQLCRGIFQALTVQESESRGIRRPQRLASLCQILDVSADELRPIIDSYRQHGVTFLIPPAEAELTDRTIIDISHESLMRVWTRLRRWVEEEAQAAGIYRRLSESAELYAQRKAGLYRDPELGIALAWREENRPNQAWAERYHVGFSGTMQFLEASRQASLAEAQAQEAARQRELAQAQQLAEARKERLEQQQRAARRLRSMIAGLAVVAGIAGMACIAAIVANRRAQQNATDANLVRQLAEVAQRDTETALIKVAAEKRRADDAKSRAVLNLKKAELAERAALGAEQRSREFRYATDMQLAGRLISDARANAGQVLARLANHDPAAADELKGKDDLRGFEWHYLKRLLESRGTIISGIEGLVSDCALTADGELIILRDDGRVLHRNAATGAQSRPPLDLAQGRSLGAKALSPDGRRAALSIAGDVHVLDSSSGQELLRLPSAATNRGLIFSPDGRMLVTLDHQIMWWDAATGSPLASTEAKLSQSGPVSISADGLTVAAGRQQNHTAFSVFRMNPEARAVEVLQDKRDASFGGTRSFAISPDGKTLAISQMFDGQVRLYDTATGAFLIANTTEHAASISAIGFGASGEMATAALDGTIKVWKNFRDLKEAEITLTGHTQEVARLFFADEGKKLVSVSLDKSIRVWELARTTASIHELVDGTPSYRGVFSPDGLLLASTDNSNEIRIKDAATGKTVRTIGQRTDQLSPHSIAWSPDGRLLAVGFGGAANTSFVELWDLDRGERLAEMPGTTDLPNFTTDERSGIISGLAFSPDGSHLVASFGSLFNLGAGKRGNSPLAVYHVPSRRIIRWLEGHKNYTTSVAFSRDGAYLASGSYDGTAILWDVKSWTRLHVLNNPDSPTDQGKQRVFDVAFSPDSKLLAMASYEGNVILWDVPSGRHLRSLSGHANGVSAVGFSPDGRTLASGSFDKTVRLWSVATWQELVSLDPSEGVFVPRALAFSPEGRRLLSTGGSAFLWSTEPVSEQVEAMAGRLALLLDSQADFESRIQMLSENLMLHEALAIVARQRPKDARVPPALAAAQANYFASRKEWDKAVEAADRLAALSPDDPSGWLRTPGLMRLATAHLHQGRPAEGVRLLAGGAKRRVEDGLGSAVDQAGIGVLFFSESDSVEVVRLLAGFPGQSGNLRPGDVVLKVDDVELNPTTIPTLSSMFPEKAGRTVRLTVRHSESEEPEVIELTTVQFVIDADTGELLHALRKELDERIAQDPQNAVLLELRAELAGQWRGYESQAADFTAAIEILSESSEENAKLGLPRLHRRRAEAYAGLERWKEAAAEYARVITPETTDEQLLSAQALAQANALMLSKWLISTAERKESVPWRYSTVMPSADWMNPDFDDSQWQEGPAGFGSPGIPRAISRTLWDSSSIWLRRSFQWAPDASLKSLALRHFHDDEAEVYLNGKRIATLPGYNGKYDWHPLGDDAVALLTPGTNVLALHCRQYTGWQYVDVGLCDAAVVKWAIPSSVTDPWQKLALAHGLANDQRAIDQLVARRPQSAGLIGDLFTQSGDKSWQRAIEMYSQGISAGKADAALLGKRARAYEALRDWDAAAADWASAAKDNADGAKLLAEFGKRLAAANEHELASAPQKQARALLEKSLQADPGDSSAAFVLAQLLLDMSELPWTVARPTEMTAKQGASLTLLEDGSILASGANVSGEVYSLAVPMDADAITAIELEAVTDSSLPNQGPGRHSSGNFQLEEFRLFVTPADNAAARAPVPIQSVWASFAYAAADADVNGIISDESKTVWHVWGRTGVPQRAIFFLKQPLSLRPDQKLLVELTNRASASPVRNDPVNLGRFRLAFTNAADAAERHQSRPAAAKIRNLEALLATAYGMAGEPERAAEMAIKALDSAEDPNARAAIVAQLQPLPGVLAAALPLRPSDAQLQIGLARHLAERGRKALAAERGGEALADLKEASRLYAQALTATPPQWKVLQPTLLTSAGGATLTPLEDGSILASGINPDRDVYTFVAPAGLKRVAGIRLEALTDPSLPQKGPGREPGGNFHLNELRVSSPAGMAILKDVLVTFDELQGHRGAIDGQLDSQRGWSIYGGLGANQTALFVADIDLSAGDELKFEMHFSLGEWTRHNLGRFRLSVIDDPAAVTAEQLHRESIPRALADLELSVAKAHAQSGQAVEAAAALGKALTLAPGPQDRSKMLDECRGMEQALAELARSLPGDLELQFALVRSFAEHGMEQLPQGKQDEALAALERSRRIYAELREKNPPTKWQVLKAAEMKTKSGAAMTLQSDGSILVSGAKSQQEVYTLQFRDLPPAIRGLRLEVLPDASLPKNGPGRGDNGNFVLSEITAALQTSVSGISSPLSWKSAHATFEQSIPGSVGKNRYGGFPIAAAVDNELSSSSGWGIMPKVGNRHSAVLELAGEVLAAPGSTLVIGLTQSYPDRPIGRFRLSATSDPHAVAAAQLDQDKTEGGVVELELALARAAIREGRTDDEAIKSLGRGIDLASDLAGVQKIICDVAGESQVAEKLAAQRPADARFHNALARFYFASGDSSRCQTAAAQARSLYEQKLLDEPENAQLAGELADLLLEVAPAEWTVLKMGKAESAGGATLTLQPDGSLLASGTNADRDVYTLTAVANLDRIAALRLEALSDPSLPHGGPGRFGDNGNFTLYEIGIWARGAAVPLQSIAATYSQHGELRRIIDGQPDAGCWSINPQSGQANCAIVSTEIADAKDQELTIKLTCSQVEWVQHNLGRFRLAVSGDPRTIEREHARVEAQRISSPWPRLGAAYHHVGDEARAVAAFAQAFEFAADDAARIEVARLAAPFCDVPAQFAGRAAEPLLKLGQAKYLSARHFASNKPAGAVAVLTEALALAPDDLELRSSRAQAYFKLGRWSQAIDDYAAVIQRQSDPAQRRQTQLALAEAQLRAGQSAAGAEIYIQEMIRAPSWGNIRDALCAQFVAGDPAAAKGVAARLYSQLSVLERDAYWSRWMVRAATAVPELVTPQNRERLLSAADKAGDYWTAPLTAAIHYRLGNLKDAQPLLTVSADRVEFLCLAALLAHDQGDHDRARQLLAQAENWFRNQRARNLEGQVPSDQDWREWGMRMGLWREATRKLASPRIAELDDLLAKEPQNAAARLERAQLLVAAGLPEEALADLTKAGPPPAGSSDNFGLRGRILAAMNRTDEALADLNKALESSTSDALVYAARGAILLKQGDFAGARSDFRRSLELAPTEAAAGGLADLLLAETERKIPWTVIQPAEMKSDSGATLTLEQDGSVFVDGDLAVLDVYTLEFAEASRPLAALRLEAIQDDRLPSGGPGTYASGNFVLSGLKVHRLSADGSSGSAEVPLRSAAATKEERRARLSLAGGENGWSIAGGTGQTQTAYFSVEPVEAEPVSGRLRVALRFGHTPANGQPATLGRFRLAVSDDPAAFRFERDRLAALPMSSGWARLAAAYQLAGNEAEFETIARQHPEAAASLADGYMQVEDWRQSLAVLDRFVTTETKDADLLIQRAELHGRLGHHDLAGADWQRALALRPKDGALRDRWIAALSAAAKWDELAREYSRQIDALPEGRMSHTPRGRLVRTIVRRGDPVFERLMAARPDDALLRIDLARNFVVRSDWQQAVAEYAKAIEKVPPAEEWYEYAAALLAAGMEAEHEQFMKRFIERAAATDEPYVAFALARAASLSPRPVALAEQLQAWCQLSLRDDRHAWYLHAAGMAQLRAGDRDAALQLLEESALTAWHPELNQIALAVVHAHRQEFAQARAYFEKAEAWLAALKPQDGYYPVQDTDWLEQEILRREAKRLLDAQDESGAK